MKEHRSATVLTFGRAEGWPDGTACLRPGANGKYEKVTYRQEYEELKAKGNYPGFRNDIALVNLEDADGHHVGQRIVYPTLSGKPEGDGWALLSKAEKDECRRINAAMLAITDPVYRWAMRLEPRGTALVPFSLASNSPCTDHRPRLVRPSRLATKGLPGDRRGDWPRGEVGRGVGEVQRQFLLKHPSHLSYLPLHRNFRSVLLTPPPKCA